MCRVWLSWLGGLAIVVAILLIVLAARDLAMAADVSRVEQAHGDRFIGVLADSVNWKSASADSAGAGAEDPVSMRTVPLPSPTTAAASGAA